MNLLILKGFNNYFNRKIKKYSDLQDYIDNSSESYNFTNINFNPNDGVATSQVIGSENQQQTGGSDPVPLMWEQNGSPDYLVAYTTETIDEQTITTIHSRWFVMESVRTRNGQYQLALKRDIIADHLEQILTNPCFVEKGYVQPNNPLIFNDEGMSFNQIKQSETMLKDETGIPWIVIYIAKNFPDSKTPDIDGGGNLPVIGNTVLDTSNAIDISSLPWYNIISSPDVSKTYRVPGAAELNISSIVASKHARTGTPNVYDFAERINCRFNYSNSDWYFDTNTSNFYKIGEYSSSYGLTNVLRRRDIGLTPADNMIHWNDDGAKVPSIVSSNTSSGDTGLSIHSYGFSVVKAAEHIAAYMKNLKNTPSLATQWNGIKTYLNSKRTNFESNTGHSAVPGQPNMEAYVGGNQAFLPASTILSYNNKLIKSGVNYYRLKITRQNNYIRQIDKFTLDGNNDIQPSATNSLKSYLPSSFSTSYDVIDYNGNPHPVNVSFESNSSNTMIETFFENAWFDIQYERVQTDKLRMTIDKPGTRIGLNEAAYDMLALPYGAIDYILPNDDNTQDLAVATSSKEASIGIARTIASKLDKACYDMQLLPYCPYRQVVEQYAEDGYVNLGLTRPFPSGSWFGVYSIINDSDTPSRVNRKSFGLYCPSCSGTFNINHTIEVPTEDSVEYKLFSATRKFRLVSPNYSSIFEFNPLKNLGVTVFNVDFNYRPYNPYIHIAPYFNSEGLYGVDTNDQRGLVLQGDFSVGYYSDAWAQYQINNANYANIFNRQLENIDFNQRQEREKFRVDRTTEGITEVLGLGGGLQGAKSFSGLGPWGMLGGGIGGTVGGITAHGVGTYYDKKWMEESMAEERSYAIDNYNMVLGNVKALPYGLAKSDVLTENFKYFPFIEEYDCTDIEKEIFRNKLKYDGMSIGAIGTLSNYIPVGDDWEFQMLKGRMIMQENIVDDFHISDAIYAEVLKGFYYVKPESEGE